MSVANRGCALESEGLPLALTAREMFDFAFFEDACAAVCGRGCRRDGGGGDRGGLEGFVGGRGGAAGGAGVRAGI